MKTLKSINVTLVLALALIVLLGYNFMSAQVWTAPTVAAPGGNISAPLNVSANYQVKTGDLGAVRIRSGSFCNAAGTECMTPGTWSCAAGQALNGINPDGTVNCVVVGGGAPAETYSWYTGPWSAWSGYSDRCGSMSPDRRTRTVTCRNSSGSPVNDSFCPTPVPARNETGPMPSGCSSGR